jgi:hypothetical protein
MTNHGNHTSWRFDDDAVVVIFASELGGGCAVSASAGSDVPLRSLVEADSSSTILLVGPNETTVADNTYAGLVRNLLYLGLRRNERLDHRVPAGHTVRISLSGDVRETYKSIPEDDE